MAESVLISNDGTLQASGAIGAMRTARFTGDVVVGGQLTASGGTFQEQFNVTAGEFSHAGLALSTTSGVPRLVFPDAATSSAFFNFVPPPWWAGMNLVLVVTNDHTATGNVRWQIRLRETDFATQAVSAGANIVDSTTTVASPSANGGLTILVGSNGVTRSAGAFGSLYSVEVTRLGADGADTLAGPIGLAGATIGRV